MTGRRLKLALAAAVPPAATLAVVAGILIAGGDDGPANVTVREENTTTALTTRSDALNRVQDRVGYRPVVPELPVEGVHLRVVTSWLPGTSDAEHPRTLLLFLDDEGAPGATPPAGREPGVTVSVAQGREDWFRPEPGAWEPVDLGMPGVQARRAIEPDHPLFNEYRLHAGGWHIMINIGGVELDQDEMHEALRQVAGKLQ